MRVRAAARILENMFLKAPKSTDCLAWTQHCIDKMRYYGLSESRVKGVLNRPKRKEEGIAPGTVAHMRPSGTKKRPSEIWIMFQDHKYRGKIKVRMISAWRYPGVTKPRDPVPIPDDIREQLEAWVAK